MNNNVMATTAVCRLRSLPTLSTSGLLDAHASIAPTSGVRRDECAFIQANGTSVVVTDNAKGADALTRLVPSLEEVPV